MVRFRRDFVDVLAMLSGCCFAVLDICAGDALAMLWRCFGDALGMFRRYLAMICLCFGNIFGDVLLMLSGSFLDSGCVLPTTKSCVFPYQCA